MAFEVYFLDSADYLTGSVGLGAKWTEVNGFGVSSLGEGRYEDGQSRHFTGTGFARGSLKSTTSWAICHTAFRQGAVSASTLDVMMLRRSGGDVISLQFVAATQKFRLRRQSTGATTLANGTYQVSINEWVHLEWMVGLDATNGESYFFVNGNTDPDFTLTGTQTIPNGAADALVDQIEIGANIHDLDFIVVQGGSPDASLTDDQVGDSFIWSAAPTGPGAHTDWSPSSGSDQYLMVDDISGAGYNTDGDSSYNDATVAGSKDSFEYDDLPSDKIDTNNIFAVQVNNVARFTGAGPATLISFAHWPVSGTPADFTMSTGRALSSTYLNELSIWETDPSGSAAWTISTINDTQWGYELLS